MSQAVVAVTATTKPVQGIVRVRLNEDYVEAVRQAGLIPLILPPRDPGEIESLLDVVDGLILTGGEDVDPSRYGAERGPHTEPAHHERDIFEIAITAAARRRRLPTLAICRGIQVANVAFGGTLVQDIASECRSGIDHERSDDREKRVHEVAVESPSRLSAAIGDAALIQVNSSHHQSLARVADGIRVTARSPDGIIEGAEWIADDWWMLGVQWHPEELVSDEQPWDRKMFQAFAEVVREGRSRRR